MFFYLKWVSASFNDKSVLVTYGDVIQLQKAILSDLYGSALGGHGGWRKLDVMVKKWFYWPFISNNIT